MVKKLYEFFIFEKLKDKKFKIDYKSSESKGNRKCTLKYLFAFMMRKVLNEILKKD
jgi:hypothetical protein